MATSTCVGREGVQSQKGCVEKQSQGNPVVKDVRVDA